jgi:ammonium transporter, Amt family
MALMREQCGIFPPKDRASWGLSKGRALLRAGLLTLGVLGMSVGLMGAESTAASAPVDASAMVVTAPPAPAKDHADPTGANNGTITDITAAKPGAPTLAEVAADAGHTKIALNMLWVLLAGAMVYLMQAGFAMVETGFTRAKSAAHTMGMNFLVYPVASLAFWAVGFGIMFGGVGAIPALGGFSMLNHEITITLFGKSMGLFGMKGFFLAGASYHVGLLTFFLFQTVFMDTTATIPTGGMAERWNFKAFILASIAVGAFLYPIYGNWVWGGGWLATLGANFGLGHGHLDFAGSSVVHMAGGVLSLVGAKFVGPRVGKYNEDGKPVAIPGHNIPMAVIGTMILAFGWFGFNPGSTLAATDMRTPIVAVNTMLASLTGAAAATAWMWNIRTGKPDLGMMCNGMLAGLVAITAPCAFVSPMGAAIIGLVSGVLVVEACYFIEGPLKIDDPVGSVAVHGVNGAWGCLALGLFADGTYGDGLNGVAGTVRGLFYGGGFSQLGAQFVGVVSNIIWFTVAGLAVYWLVDKLVGMRSKIEDEIQGLDIPEMGSKAYPSENTSLLG